MNGLPSPCMALCRRWEALSGSWFPPAGLTVPFKGKEKENPTINLAQLNT